MKSLVLTLTACILGVAAALFVLMFRRDQGIHGLVGLTLATCAGYVALIYAAVGQD
jgi:hypothetical protein